MNFCENRNSENNKFANIIFNVSLLLGFLLPHTNNLFLTINMLLPLAVYLSGNNKRYFNRYMLLVCIYLSFVFAINLFSIDRNIENKDIFRFVQWVILFFFFPISRGVNINKKILLAIFFAVIVSQLAMVFNITNIVDYIRRFYFDNSDLIGDVSLDRYENASNSLSGILGMRYGGIYGNQNQYARYLTLLYIVVLIECNNIKYKYVVFLQAISFISIILSGSRTGLVAYILITLFYILKRFPKKKKQIISSCILGTFLFIVARYSICDYSRGADVYNIRGLDISSGLDNSIGIKIMWLFEALHSSSPLGILLGNLTSSDIDCYFNVTMLDSEWGEAIFCWGIIGSILYLVALIQLYMNSDNKIKFLLLVFLWAISSTILFSFRMSFLFILLLSKYYYDYNFKLK